MFTGVFDTYAEVFTAIVTAVDDLGLVVFISAALVLGLAFTLWRRLRRA
jgi:hypothetical protein